MKTMKTRGDVDVNAITPAGAAMATQPPYHRNWASCRPNVRSEEHTSELQSLMRISYAVFCLKKNKETTHTQMLRATTPQTTTSSPQNTPQPILTPQNDT